MGEFEKAYGLDDNDEESPETGVSRVVNDLDLDDKTLDEQMREAEKRLLKGAYYRTIVTNGVVEDDGTPQASEVNAEARLWAREQMAKLVGILSPAPAPQPPPAQFTEREVLILKKVAETAATKMSVVVAAPPKAVLSKVPPAPQPAVATSSLKKPKPVASKVADTKPDPTSEASKKPRPMRVKRGADGAVDYEAIPSGQVFKDVDGLLYRFIDNRNYDSEATYEKLLEKGLAPDAAEKLASRPRIKSKVVAAGNAGHKRRPMPDNSTLEQLTAVQSQQSVSLGRMGGENPDPNSDQNTFIQTAVAAVRS